MKTITLSDDCFNELSAALAGSTPTVPSPRPTPEPVVPPAQPPFIWPTTSSDDWQQQAREAAARQGYDPVTLFEWDWSSDISHVDTSSIGMLGARGVLIISFIPTAPVDNVLAVIDAIGFPVSQNNWLTLSLSDQPCDFSLMAPAQSYGNAPTIPYMVGMPIKPWVGPVREVGLTPGKRYFLNTSGRSTFDPTSQFAGEIRVALRKPQGH